MLALIKLLTIDAGLQWGDEFDSRPKDLRYFALKKSTDTCSLLHERLAARLDEGYRRAMTGRMRDERGAGGIGAREGAPEMGLSTCRFDSWAGRDSNPRHEG